MGSNPTIPTRIPSVPGGTVMIDVFMRSLQQAEQEADAVVQNAREKVKALEKETVSSVSALTDAQSKSLKDALSDIEQSEAERMLERRAVYEKEQVLSIQHLEETVLARRDRVIAGIISSITKH